MQDKFETNITRQSIWPVGYFLRTWGSLGAIFFTVILSCGSAGPGNSSEVLNGTFINSNNGQPACHASVVMRSRDYLPELQSSEIRRSETAFFVCSTFTDSRGEYNFSAKQKIPDGVYCIEGRDSNNNCALIDSVVVAVESNYSPLTDTLKSPATISGTLPLKDDSTKAFVRVYGLDAYEQVKSNGDFSLSDLPEGNLRLYILIARGDTMTYDTIEVTTLSGRMRTIDSLVSPRFVLIYNGNGNTEGIAPADGNGYFAGDSATILGSTGAGSMNRTGFTFIGWNTEPDGSGIGFTAGGKYRVSGMNVTLYAQWRPDGMTRIPAKDNTFQMGDTFSYDDRQLVHPVKFGADFWIDTTEVTQGSYTAVMTAAYGGQFVSPAWNATYGAGENYPAYFVNWYDAVLYCNARTKASKSPDTVYSYTSITGTPGNGCILQGVTIKYNVKGFRLPTEAEWEYAYRAGAKTDPNSDSATINEYQWYSANYGSSKMHRVAQISKNAFGLYDMSWNVSEWCNDWYGTYGSSLQIDPTGPSSGSQRVIRGGSWATFSSNSGLVCRGKDSPEMANNDYGFRVCFPTK